ncbi:MAG: hypothetical protein GF411_13330 [Candidatus Lokiarchaeota archaeon]|nr:hypothetical protein [Candidatus Lokiarchaeota archaeon]
MQTRKHVRISGKILVVFSLFVMIIPMFCNPAIVNPNLKNISIEPLDSSETHELGESSRDGVLDSRSLEKIGYSTSGIVSARTDIYQNLQYNHQLDITHNWIASEASVNVSNLARTYAVNGTFDDGIVGINTNLNDSVDYYPFGWYPEHKDTNPDTKELQKQIAEYHSNGYVSAENRGKSTHVNFPTFLHSAGTYILWNQSFPNLPYTSNFILSLKYLYLQGPIDGVGGDALSGNCSVSVFVDDIVVWNQSLLTLDSRDVWYESGDIPISLPLIGNASTIMVGLYIDEELNLDPDLDYDGDTIEDGFLNTAYISILLDDISLIGQTAPSFEEVDFKFYVENTSSSVIGSNGVGYSSVINTSYWNQQILPVNLTSNSSISFDYETRLKIHQFGNTTWTTAESSYGVHYSIDFGSSTVVETYSYMGSLEEYQNLSLRITLPTDWENITIQDPFLSDVTSQCQIYPGLVIIPDTLLIRLGWWKLSGNTPNYARTINTQIYSNANWMNESLFRSTNLTRVSARIETSSETPSLDSAVEISYLFPNGTVWYLENNTTGTNGSVNSTALTFGSLNASAGQWSVQVFWENGSEIAYDEISFELHHQSLLIAVNEYIETEVGEVITNFVRFIDAENGEHIMTSASIVANWSGSEIVFSPNDVRKSWEADFNTSLISPGNNTVIVNASVDYYDNASCSFIIRTVYTNNLLLLSEDTAQIGLYSNHTAIFHYEDRFGNPIDGATLDISYSGSSGGVVLGQVVPLGNGNYQVNITSQLAGSYSIRFHATKSFYEFAEDTLFLFVSSIETKLSILNGSAAAVSYGQTYEVFIEYVNSTDYGLDNATVEIASITPMDGVDYGDSVAHGNGIYSFSISSTSSGTYSIVIQANLTNHITQLETFSLTFTNESMVLSLDLESSIQIINENMEINFRLENSTDLGVEEATITCINLPESVPVFNFLEIGDGNYSITMAINTTGSFQLVFVATVPNHVDASTSLTITVVKVPTRLYNPVGTSNIITVFGSVYNFSVFYERTDYNQNITSGNIQLSGLNLEGLEWNITKIDEEYILSFSSEEPGLWSVIVTISKENYQSATLELAIEIRPISSELQIFSPSSALTINRDNTFQFSYLRENSTNGIDDATISISGTGSDWVEWDYIGDGLYNITIRADEIGSYRVQFVFSKLGYETQQGTFNFEVDEIPLEIVMDSIVWQQGQPLTIELQLIESDTGSPSTGAYVEYRLTAEGISPITGVLEESEPGTYSTTITPPWPGESGYEMSITVDQENAELTGAFSSSITALPDIAGEIMRTATIVGTGAAAAIGIIAVTFMAYRYKKQKDHERFVRAMTIKNRFDDANNIIGLVVLHKISGLPIYSRAIKGGFEEGMIGAFITAITHFQSEFEGNERDTLFQIIPISDILRTVPTEQLMCAFITINPASKEQEQRMVEYARRVGELMDDTVSVETSQVHDEKTIATLDYIFDDVMDGFLLGEYHFKDKEEYPEKYECIVEGVNNLESDSFQLVELARSMASCGVRVADTYLLIMDAYEIGLLEQIGRSELNSLDLSSELDLG